MATVCSIYSSKASPWRGYSQEGAAYLTRLVMAENARGGAWSNLLLLLHPLHHFQSSVTTSKMNILESIVVFEPQEGNYSASKGISTTCVLNLPFPKTQMLRVFKRITRARPFCDALINLKQIIYAGGWSGEARQDQASIITSCNTDIAPRVSARIKNRVGFLHVIHLG